MTIEKMMESLERLRNMVGGEQEVPIVLTGHGENDYVIPMFPVVGNFEDQDGNSFRCALVGGIGGEEFTRKGIPHYDWDPKSDDPGCGYDGKLHVNMKRVYPEDAIVNGLRDDVSTPTMPGYDHEDGSVKWDIDIETGTILNWVEGVTATVHYKVVDEFEFDYRGFHYDDYVPKFMEIDDEGYGDYVCVTIDGCGRISGWSKDRFLAVMKEMMDDE